MKIISNLIIIASIFLLYSCWVPCAPTISGEIIDKNTEMPITNATIEVFEGSKLQEAIKSDSTGSFHTILASRSNFMFTKCEPEFKLSVSKSGYDTVEYFGTAPEIGIKIEID